MSADESEAVKEWTEAHRAYEALVAGGSIDELVHVDFTELVEATQRVLAASRHMAAHRNRQPH